MTISITHQKTNNIADWTQADLDAVIAGNAPPLPPSGTVLNDIVLPSDWNHAHTITGADANAVLFTNGLAELSTNTNFRYDGRTLVVNDADVTYTPTAPTSLNINFISNGSGFLANGTIYQFTVHAYWYTGSSYAYNSSGSSASASDPNDLNNYDVEPSWSGATDANGYILVDDATGYWIDVGNVTSYTVTPSTSWNTSSVPSLSPNSIVEAGHPIWVNNNIDYGTSDFNFAAMGLSGSNHLELRWLAAGAGGQGALRFQDDAGNLKYINANCYGENAYFSNQVTAGSFSGYVYPATFGQNYIAYGASGGYITGSSVLTFNPSTTRMLLSNSGITAQSQLHMHYSTATAVNTQYTNSSTGSTSGDGTLVGITTTGAFEIKQQENLPINIYTLGTLRAQYAASASPRYTVYGGIEAQYNALANTSTDGLLIDNLTSATSGVPIQRAGRINFLSNVWDTSASATRVDNWIIQPVLTSGGPATSILSFERQYNSGGYTAYLNLSSAGNLAVGLGTTAGSARLHISSSSAEIARFARDSANNAAVSFTNTGGSVYCGKVSSGAVFSVASTADVTVDGKFYVDLTNGRVGVMTSAPDATFEINMGTAGSQRWSYNDANGGATTYAEVSLSSVGVLTFDAVGSGAGFAFADSITIADSKDIILNTTTGTKIGTATTQKLGFWNATPIVQPTTAVAAATRVGGGGAALTDTDTFDGYTIAQVVKALRNMGKLA